MEQAQGMSQGQDAQVSSSAPSQTPSSAPAPQASEERTFRQTDVNDLVRRAKSEAVESYRRQQQEQPQYIEQKYGQSNQQPQSQGESPDDRIRRLASEAAQSQIEKVRQDYQQRSQEEMAQKTVQNFRSKVQAARDKYQDFDKVVPANDMLASYPNVVQLLGDYIDNSGDVLYHLGQNLTKMELIESMAGRSAQGAIREMQKLSQSLKDNEASGKVSLPNEPLSQMRPSNTGTVSGAMSVRDYRNRYKV